MPRRTEVVGVADTAELQQLRRVERPAAQDDLAGGGLLRATATGAVLDPGRACAVEQHAMDEGACGDREVLAVHHRVEIGARRAEPAAAPDVAVELGEALLLDTR